MWKSSGTLRAMPEVSEPSTPLLQAPKKHGATAFTRMKARAFEEKTLLALPTAPHGAKRLRHGRASGAMGRLGPSLLSYRMMTPAYPTTRE